MTSTQFFKRFPAAENHCIIWNFRESNMTNKITINRVRDKYRSILNSCAELICTISLTIPLFFDTTVFAEIIDRIAGISGC